MGSDIPFRDRISCTIREACLATGIGRTKLYQEIAAGRIRTSKVGRRTLVLVESLVTLIDPQPTSEAPKCSAHP
jgi:excisionase family DNA binding protein